MTPVGKDSKEANRLAGKVLSDKDASKELKSQAAKVLWGDKKKKK